MSMNLLFLLGFIACVAASANGALKKSNHVHTKANLPSLLSVSNTEIFKKTELTLTQQPPTAHNSGLTYLEFYSEASCGGVITYTSGYKSEICLPANDYVRPPFADDDDFYSTLPFRSLRISNVTDSCDGWYTTYYKDTNCTEVYNVQTLDDYADCRVATDLQVSNMVSVRGKCSLTVDPLPVMADSFVVSDYTGKQQCVANELVSFTAYSTDTCFGYGTYSSTYFTYNDTSNSVHETQYYASSNCTRQEGGQTAQSDYTISLADACNEVHSPNAPVDDDSVAWTEFVGISYIAGPTAAPTPAPTRQPTAAPTSVPTAAPSAAPTPNNLIHFAAQQVISGISLATYNTNATLYGNTLRMSIASCMEGVVASNVLNLVATSSNSAVMLTARAHSKATLKAALVGMRGVTLASAGDAISISYEVSVHNSAQSYDSLSTQLSSAVINGAFDDYVGMYSSETGATGLQGTTCSNVETQNLAPSDSDSSGDDDKLSDAEIAGIVLGGAAGLLLIGVGVWLCLRWRGSSNSAPAAATAAAPRTSRNTDGSVTVNPLGSVP